MKDATGVNVMTPLEFTTYEPTFGTVIVVPAATVQLFGVWAGVVVGLHSRNVKAVNVAPLPAESFARRFFVWAVLYAPVDVSAAAEGAGTTVGVTVAVADEPAESVIW